MQLHVRDDADVQKQINAFLTRATCSSYAINQLPSAYSLRPAKNLFIPVSDWPRSISLSMSLPSKPYFTSYSISCETFVRLPIRSNR